MYRSLRTSLIALALGAAVVAAAPTPASARPQPSPTPTATPSPGPEDPAVTRIARREFVSWQAGSLDMSAYAEKAKSQLTSDKITKTSQALGQLGALVSTQWLGPIVYENAPPDVKGYLYRMICTQGAVYEEMVLDAQGKITGIIFRDKLIQ